MERVSAGIQVLLYISETVLQVLTATQNARIGPTYCWLIVGFIVVSSLITNSVSLAWVYKGMDFADRRTGECLCIGLHTFQLGIPWRFLKLWLAGDQKDTMELVVLRLLQASVQSGPFLVLQTWLTLDKNHHSHLSLAAMGVSLVSLAFTYASNTEPLHKVFQVRPDGNASVIQFTTRFFCHVFIMVARFLAIAIFGLLTRSWIVLALVAHFFVSTVLMILHKIWKAPQESKLNKVVILTTLQSYGCTFAPVPFSRMSYSYLLYFIIVFLENLLMATVWFIQRTPTSGNVVLYTISLTSFLAGFIIACLYSKTLGVFSRGNLETLNESKSSNKSAPTLSKHRRSIRERIPSQNSNASFVIDMGDTSEDIGFKTSTLKSSRHTNVPSNKCDCLEDLDDVIPSQFFMRSISNSKTVDSVDSGIVHNQSQTDSCHNQSQTDSYQLQSNSRDDNNDDLIHNQGSSDTISSGCCTDTSLGSISNVQTSEESPHPEVSPGCDEGVTLHSTPKRKLSVIEITETERMLIDNLLKTGECLLDGQDGELSSSGCFGESSSEYSVVLNETITSKCVKKSCDKLDKTVEVPILKVGTSKSGEPNENIITDKVTGDMSQIEMHYAESDVFSTTYQTISSCPSDFPQLDRRLPSLTSSVTRTWADAAMSSSTSTCDTCTTCRESFERSCSDSSWSSSQDTLDLLETDTDCMTWPPRKVNIVNLHDLPREKLSLDDRISKWLKEVTLPPRHSRRSPPLHPQEPLPSLHSDLPKKSQKLVYIASQDTASYNKLCKKTKQFPPFNMKIAKRPKTPMILHNRPLSRSHSLTFLMKLCNAASFRRKKVILFNHLREECQRHRDPFNSGLLVS